MINFFFNLLQTRDEQLCKDNPQRRKSHFFNSFFISKLCGSSGEVRVDRCVVVLVCVCARVLTTVSFCARPDLPVLQCQAVDPEDRHLRARQGQKSC